MRNKSLAAIAGMAFVLLFSGALHAADQPGQASAAGGEGTKGQDGVIGISLYIGANRVGDPASLYVGRVHREGPAHKAGLRHGDELVSVDGAAVTGKSYEQVVKMVRGEAGTNVKLGVKREGEGLREISVARVAGDQLMKGSADHGTYKDKPQAQP
jgi:C-terminal processing protease CtpA/Prc